MFKIRFAIIFQEDGLDLEGMKTELSDCGKVTDVQDDEIINDDGSKTPVKIVYMDSDLAGYMKVKIRYNCVENPMQKYVLWPMENYFEKMKAMEMFGAV